MRVAAPDAGAPVQGRAVLEAIRGTQDVDAEWASGFMHTLGLHGRQRWALCSRP